MSSSQDLLSEAAATALPSSGSSSTELSIGASLMRIDSSEPNTSKNVEIIELDADLEFAKELDRTLNGTKVPEECNSDLEFARKLHEELNKEEIPESSKRPQSFDDDVVVVPHQIETIEVRSDDEDEDLVVIESSYDNPVDEVIFAGTSMGSINFVIQELGIKYNPATSFDWKQHSMKLNLKGIFGRFSKLYFNEPECFKHIELGWTTDLGNKPARLRLLTDKTQISLNHNLKLVPRIEFLSQLLRVMLILFIREKYGLGNNIVAFKKNFLKSLQHINKVWMTNVRESGDLTFNHEVDKRCWYRCTGMCQDHAPFYGTFRSATEPGGHCSWWLTHRTNCSATLFRLYEVTKFIGNTPSNEERFFVTNVKHRSLKVDLKKANKDFLKPEATIDLDMERQGSEIPSEATSYIDIIDNQRDEDLLYGHRLSDPVDRLGLKPAEEFMKYFDRSLGVDYNGYLIPCPICGEKVNRRLFGEHFDGCMGFSQKVEYKPVRVNWEEWPNAKRVKY
ncbi:uncharacterized protein LOC134827878 [Culicoides brevitarsis]|uniref:uncharacterized protein LOC134827878 n=1 Tax=Culicoides brevitarsis TaxID=469753 RepID=UPI00307CB7A1